MKDVIGQSNNTFTGTAYGNASNGTCYTTNEQYNGSGWSAGGAIVTCVEVKPPVLEQVMIGISRGLKKKNKKAVHHSPLHPLK